MKTLVFIAFSVAMAFLYFFITTARDRKKMIAKNECSDRDNELDKIQIDDEVSESEDIRKYGQEIPLSSEYSYEDLKMKLILFGECEVTVAATTGGVGLGCNPKKEEKKLCSSNLEITPFLEECFKKEGFTVIFGPKSFAETVFYISCREKEKKSIHLKSPVCGTPNSPIIQYEVYIREV